MPEKRKAGGIQAAAAWEGLTWTNSSWSWRLAHVKPHWMGYSLRREREYTMTRVHTSYDVQCSVLHSTSTCLTVSGSLCVGTNTLPSTAFDMLPDNSSLACNERMARLASSCCWRRTRPPPFSVCSQFVSVVRGRSRVGCVPLEVPNQRLFAWPADGIPAPWSQKDGGHARVRVRLAWSGRGRRRWCGLAVDDSAWHQMDGNAAVIFPWMYLQRTRPAHNLLPSPAGQSLLGLDFLPLQARPLF